MAGTCKRFTDRSTAVLLVFLTTFQGMVFPGDLEILPVSNGQTESFADFLVDLMGHHDGWSLADEIPDNTEPDGESEEENFEKDDSKFHEFSDLNFGLPFAPLNKKGLHRTATIISLCSKIPTPPPES